jgi:hypothetical protein
MSVMNTFGSGSNWPDKETMRMTGGRIKWPPAAIFPRTRRWAPVEVNEGGLREFTREFNLPRTTVRAALDLGKLDPAVKEQADAAGLTVLERAEHINEWVELTRKKTNCNEADQIGQPHIRNDSATCASSLPDGRKAGPQHQSRGTNAAVRKLHIDRTEAQRSVKGEEAKWSFWTKCPETLN